MATIADLMIALTTHLEILDELYGEAKDLKDHTLNALTFDGKNYNQWITTALSVLDDHISASNPHELTREQIDVYSKNEVDASLLNKVSKGNLPLSMFRLGDNTVLGNYIIPIGIDATNQPISFNGTDWMTNPTHLLLNGDYRYVDNTSTDAIMFSDLLVDELVNITADIPVYLYLVLDSNTVKFKLTLDSEALTPETNTSMYIGTGTINVTGITINDTDWFIRLGNHRLTPNATELKGGSIAFRDIIPAIIEVCNDSGVCFINETDDFISYTDLSTHFEVTEGTVNSTDQADKWLHFKIDNKELFVSKVSIRDSISWDHLYSKGLVYGTNDNGLYPTGTPTNQYKTITLNGQLYKCRLLKGADPTLDQVNDGGYDTSESQQSEWSRLFYPIVNDDPDMFSYTGPMLANYVEVDLQMRWVDDETTPGSFAWCQERHGTNTAARVMRGGDGVSHMTWDTSSFSTMYWGWHACLELVS